MGKSFEKRKWISENSRHDTGVSRRILWLALILFGISAVMGGILLSRHLNPVSTKDTEAEKILNVQASIPFQILIPAYLPKQFDRTGVDVNVNQKGPGGEPMVQLTYRTRTGATLFVREWVPVNPDMEVLASSRPIQTKWGRGWMLSQGQNLFTLWVDVGPLRTSIYTTRLDVLKREEVLAIANSLGPASNRQVFSLVEDTPQISEVPAPAPFESQPTDSVNSPAALPAELPEDVVTTAKWEDGAELLGVGFAADGGFIIVRFKLPPRTAGRLMQGQVYVVHEATGTTYREIAVMPEVGPLIARPKKKGQSGYVMLTNAPQRLPKGSVVTVVLGNYRQEHVIVQ